MGAGARIRFARFGIAIGLVSIAIAGWSSSPAAAQQWASPEPDQGEAGTEVTMTGNLIGCYGSGPGLESATWGLPDRVVLYFDNEVRDSEGQEQFASDLADDPNEAARLEEVASHDFGDAGWELSFTVPDVRPGPHLMVLAFEPQCNHKSVEDPNGFTNDPSQAILSFCITEDDVCPSAASTLPSGGQDFGGGTQGFKTGRGSVDILSGQIRTNEFIAWTATIAIIAVIAWAGAAAVGAGGGASTALPAAPAAALPAATGSLVAAETVVPGCAYTMAELLSLPVGSSLFATLPTEVLMARSAWVAFEAGTATARQVALLTRLGLLVP